MNVEEAKQIFSGPIPSLRTTFARDGAIDLDGMTNQIERAIAGGSKALMLTVGDSHYLCLSDEEIAQITRFACEQARGRAAVIAADRMHATARAVTFAEFARDAGASTVMCMPPDWAGSCTAAGLAEHYAAVAKVLPVTIVTNIFISRGAAFGFEAIARSLDASNQVIAIKDDVCGDFAQKLCMREAHRVAIHAGGQKINHLSMWPFGVHGYLSTFAVLQPEIANRYWSAISSGRREQALDVIRRIDSPWFEHIIGYNGSFDAAIHGALELLGIAKRWRRPPYHSLTDAEMNLLREFHATVGIG